MQYDFKKGQILSDIMVGEKEYSSPWKRIVARFSATRSHFLAFDGTRLALHEIAKDHWKEKSTLYYRVISSGCVL